VCLKKNRKSVETDALQEMPMDSLWGEFAPAFAELPLHFTLYMCVAPLVEDLLNWRKKVSLLDNLVNG
jgi:hypothetical protein